MIEVAIMVGLLLTLLAIVFWPRRSPCVRRVTKSYNGQHRGKDRELY